MDVGGGGGIVNLLFVIIHSHDKKYAKNETRTRNFKRL